ncbi:MAG: hypothetical protein ACYTAS_14010 [Planctomycetota bacterium]
MIDARVDKPFDPNGFVGREALSAQRLLPGEVRAARPIHVDVHVRTCGDGLPVTRPTPAVRLNRGRLPVGTLLDCYL